MYPFSESMIFLMSGAFGCGILTGSDGIRVEHIYRNYSFPYARAPDLADFWPHETTVSWIRSYMKKNPLEKGVGIDAMQQQFKATMRDCVRHINSEYNVDDLCSSFPRRPLALKAASGGRLNH